MAWYDGKSSVVALCFGDSNMGGIAAGVSAQLGVQTYNPNTYFYARNGSVPYVQSGHTWRHLDNDAASRLAEQQDANGGGAEQGTLYVGQVLGGLGSPSMQLADTIQQGTGLDVYSYLGCMGGSTAEDWASYLWPQLKASFNEALAAIPGSPTAADVIYFSLGGGDLFWGTSQSLFLAPDDWHHPATPPTAQEFYDNFLAVRSLMVEEGWWVPGVTQIVFNEISRGNPALEAYPAWQGIEYILRRLNDRIAMITSIGRTYDPVWTVHYSPQSYTDMGREAGEKVVAQIPKQQSGIAIDGARLSVGGGRLRVHST